MTSRTLQGGDSHPARVAGIKGEQLRSHQFRVQKQRQNLEVEFRTEGRAQK
jgi:hypothetical protein